MIRLLTIAIAGMLACGPAIADKPAAAAAATAKVKQAGYFGDRHWTLVRDYYNEQIRAGNCPLGFVKREDGCAPPDQARKWAIGKPLPQNAVRFDVPHALSAKLGKPPAGHRYVRVGADVLLVSNRTGLVVDGILDLGRK